MKQTKLVQTQQISIAANAGTGVTKHSVELNTEYARVKGVVVHQIGTHDKYQVGFENKDGEQIMGRALYSHYGQIGNERFHEADFPVSDQKIFITVNILETQNAALDFEVVFDLHR